MRILLVTNIFPPQIGGPATFIDRLAHALAAEGYRVTVVCSSDQPRDPGDAARPFRVKRICLKPREWYEIKVRLVLFWQLLTHRRVVVNGLEGYVAQIAPRIGRRYLLKIVGDSAWQTARNQGTTALDIDVFQRDAEAQRIHAALVRGRNAIFANATAVFTPSDYLRGMVIGWGVPAERVLTVLNGTDPCAARPEPPAGSGFRVLFVGRLTNWKGVETLLIALQRLTGVEVTVVGDGPAWPTLVELAKQLGVDRQVRFAGRGSRSEVGEAMRACHCLVLTSLYEGLSHTLLEAMALGVPVIASACGGNNELVQDGVNGLLVPPQDPPALATAIARLQADVELRRRLAAAAWETGRRHDIATTVAAVAALVKAKL